MLLSAIKSKKIKNEDYLLNNIAKKLPNYMIPKKFKIYKDFPLNEVEKLTEKK